ncbi:hypothetical protein BGW39_008460 [Mortierella sp. 14UC]|nr:hypothetical protein BGW39_008460 [Mortierella sp. 14UC]
MSAYLLAVPSGDEPLELTKTAPVLDPNIPFFKYLDMLALISKDALSLRQQAYEIFLALNPHLSYASVSISNAASTQPTVKLNKKADILLKSSMILIQRYCLILQVSLPKLPSFRRRTHTSTLKAYEIRAVGYQDDLTQYQEEGALLFLQACFVRSQAAQRDMSKLAPSQRVTDALSMDGRTITKGPTAISASAKSTERVAEKEPSRTEEVASIPVVIAEAEPTSLTPAPALSRLSRSVAIEEMPPMAKNQAIALTTAAVENTTPAPAVFPTRRTSRRKKQSAEAQVKVEIPSSTTDTPVAEPSEHIPLTESALWKWERDLEKLREAGAMMEEQIVQSAHIRASNKSPTTTTPAAPPLPTSTPTRSTPAASYFPSVAHAAVNASTVSAEPAKRAKSKNIVAPTVILTAPTPPAVTPSTMPKSLATRAIFTPAPPTVTKSTTKRMSPATGALRGSGVVRNLIRQYETPSSSSSTSSKGDRPDLLAARKLKPTAAVATTTTTSATSTAEKPGAAAAAAAAAKTKAPVHVSSSTAKTRTAKDPAHNPGTSPAPVRNKSNDQTLATAPSIQTTKTKDGKRTFRSNADVEVKTSPLATSSSPRPDPSTASSSIGSVAMSYQAAATVSTTHTSAAGSHSKASTGKQVTLNVPVQGYQTRPRPSLNASGLWSNPPPPLSQLRTISSSSVNTVATSSSIATVFRDGAESKPVVALGSHTFAPSNPPLEDARSIVATVSEVNFGNRSSPGSTFSKAMSSDESIRSWRQSVPAGVTAGGPSNHTMHQSHQASQTSSPTAEVGAFDWMNEEGHPEEDDDKSHIDLIRIPTMSSIRSSATASTTRTHSFSATSPLGSARFKPRKRPSLKSALVQATKKEDKVTADVKEANMSVEKKSGYVPETDESDTETANLQYLDVPPVRGTQAWLDMRAQELEQEEKRRLLEEEDNANGSEDSFEVEADASPLVKTLHDSKYSTMTIAGNGMNSQQQTATSSRPPLSQVHFGPQSPSQAQEESQQIQSIQREGKQELDETTSSSLRGRVPSFTRPFKPEHRRAEYQPSFISSSGYRQNDSRPPRHYASTASSSSTCTVRQPAPRHSVSPAPSAFATLRATASISSSMAPSVKSFATGSTVTLRTPKFFPPLSYTTSTVSASARSFFPAHGQTDDGGATANAPLSPNMHRIRAREVSVLGSLAEPILASQPLQMNVQTAATTLVRNGSSSHAAIYAQQQRQRQQEQQEEEFQQMYQQYRSY